ncbi:MAG: hypothetical protein AAF252_04395 [Pseudomonadota bacterium]
MMIGAGVGITYTASLVSISAPMGLIEFATIGDQVGGSISLSYQATGNVDVTVLVVPVGTVASTNGLAAQIAAQSVTGGMYLSAALTAAGTSIALGTLPNGLGGDFDFFVMPDGGDDASIIYAESAALDSLNPTLSAPLADATGQTELTLTITTNEASGTIYALSRAPTDPIATVPALLASAFENANPTVGTNGIVIGGLTTGVAQVIDAMQVDAFGNASPIVTSPEATPASPTVFSDVFDDANGTILQDKPNWTNLAQGTGTGRFVIEDGNLFMQVAQNSTETTILNMPASANVDVEFDVTELGVSPHSVECVIKIDANDQSTKLIFLMDAAGGVARLRGFTAGAMTLQRWLPTPITLSTYRFVVQGQQISTYIDGVLNAGGSGTWSNTFVSSGSGISAISQNRAPLKIGRIRAEVLP